MRSAEELCDHFGPAVDAELGEDPPDMRRHRPEADVEHAGDQSVRRTVGDEPCDLRFARAEAVADAWGLDHHHASHVGVLEHHGDAVVRFVGDVESPLLGPPQQLLESVDDAGLDPSAEFAPRRRLDPRFVGDRPASALTTYVWGVDRSLG
jgi:hypothetical protein